MWKISVQMASFPASCFSRRRAVIAEFPRAGWASGVLCVPVVKLGDSRSGSRPLIFFQAFISALGGESSLSQTCPFLGRLPSGMTPGTTGTFQCPHPPPQTPAPQAGAGGTPQSPRKQALRRPCPALGVGRLPLPHPRPRPASRHPPHTHLGPVPGSATASAPPGPAGRWAG